MKKLRLMTLITVFTVVFLASCFTDWKGEGTIAINLGNGNSRSVMPWPTDDLNYNIFDYISYKITISSNMGTEYFTANGTDTNIRRTVAVGHWNVKIEAYLEGLVTKLTPNSEQILYAIGNNSVDVKAGQNNSVSVTMTKAFEDVPETYAVTFISNGGTTVPTITDIIYGNTISKPNDPTNSSPIAKNRFRGWYTDDGTFKNEFNFSDPITESIELYADWGYRIGDKGPGGGIIYYRSEVGFDFFTGTTVNDNFTEKRYYLEAAPNDIPTTLRWNTKLEGSEVIDIPGTETVIGTGRKNTNLILTIDVSAPAALECRNFIVIGYESFDDWFLPSEEELIQLKNNSTTIGNFLPGGYWSSSQMNISSAFPVHFGAGGLNAMKEQEHSVRAIRAF